MKKNIQILTMALVVATASLFFSSCKKYDEGPSLSFRSKTARISNHWKYKSVKTGGTDFTSLFQNFTIEIKKDGTYTTYNSGVQSDKGKWEFDDKKEAIKVTEEGSSSSETWSIKRLKEKEMIFEMTDNNVVTRVEAEPK